MPDYGYGFEHDDCTFDRPAKHDGECVACHRCGECVCRTGGK